MQESAAFTIYNASAGSGKTFTLVKEYLKLILQSNKEGYYRHLLAITFTNKAVAEMKQRIIKNLFLFSKPEVISDPPQMLLQLSHETTLTVEELHRRAHNILKHLLHHYAGFTIETIDRFNHQLLRTFAKDLKLPQNFEVSLDAPQLLAEAVDQLIAKAGIDAEITSVLLDFALEKTDDDKSWDISKDIAQAAQIILSENDGPHLAKLKNKSLHDFLMFKKRLLAYKLELTQKIKQTASETLQLIEEAGLQYNDFNRGSFPSHLQKLANADFTVSWDSQWQTAMTDTPMYPKRVAKETPEIVPIIDELVPVFVSNFETTKQDIIQVLLLDAILKNITPLSVVNLVNQELEIIKSDRSIMPISEFNAIINNEIKNQPAPFIYERLGEKYRHFFIDEFQDTSLLQWQNLIPLIDNALSQQTIDEEQGSLLLVGDAKQAIYRWRGGLPEQFIGLYGAENPFSVSEKKVLNLETNYRSCDAVIDFNNAFFSFTASYFGNVTHQDLYKIGNRQASTQKKGGYVKFEFIPCENKAVAHEIYAQKVLETITHITNVGFEYSDICILTRTKKEGILLGAALLEHGIPIISSETLLLQHSPLVQCVLDLISLQLYPENEEVKIRLLSFLYDHFQITEAKHTFFSNLVHTSPEMFERGLEKYGVRFRFNKLQSVSLYESCEYCIKQFRLYEKADGYLIGFMDLVFDFQQKPQAGKLAFLTYWETKKDTASTTSSPNINAVQLMTIHKAKGLEFPVVVFPYADVELYTERNAKTWFPWTHESDTFDEVYINYNKSVSQYGDIGASIFQSRRETLELDTINLLYVTLTRAIEQVYILATMPKDIKEGPPKNFNEMFGGFLKNVGKWNEGVSIAEFGTVNRCHKTEPKAELNQIHVDYIASSPQEHNLRIVSAEALIWDTDAESAIALGNLLHETMARIKVGDDVASIFDLIDKRSILSDEEIRVLKKMVLSIVGHPQLVHLYSSSRDSVANERDIITTKEEILRPDRLNFHENASVSIVDYKTGTPKELDEIQINRYATALEEMNFSVLEKILVYASEETIFINKV